MCDILCTYTSHSEVTQLCAEYQGSCRQAHRSSGFLASGPSPVRTMKMQSPSSTSESLRSCASLPCSDERLVYLQGPSVPGKQCAGRGLGVGLGTGMALRAQSRRLLSLLLLASLPFQTYFLDPSTPFQGIAVSQPVVTSYAYPGSPVFGAADQLSWAPGPLTSCVTSDRMLCP